MSGSLLNEYISKRMSATDLESELMRLVVEYNKKKGSYLFVYASDMNKSGSINPAELSLSMNDYHIIHEMLRTVNVEALDLYIETPGGSGEAAEEIVEFLHSKFETVDFVIAGEAKSAGTLMTMSADDIYMTDSGSLGPIDAQVKIGRSVVSAFDYVRWMDQKREEAHNNKQLNPVDATMIAQITPGEFESVFNAQQFVIDKLQEWLPKYKFKHWKETETRKLSVNEEMKKVQAEKIAKKLINRAKWLSHGRSLKIKELEDIGLRIRRLEDTKEICEIVYRIKTVLRVLFGSSTHYKVFVTETEKLFRDAYAPGFKRDIQSTSIQTPVAEITATCPQCGKRYPLYTKFGKLPGEFEKNLAKKATKFPVDNKLSCECGFQFDLSGLRNQLEKQIGRKIVD